MKKARTLVVYSSLPPVGGHSTITLKIIEAFRDEFDDILVLTRDLPGHGLCEISIGKLRSQGVRVERVDKDNRVVWPALLARLGKLRLKGVDTFLCVGMGGLSPLMSKALNPRRSIFYQITYEGKPEEFQVLNGYSPSFDSITVISPLSIEPLEKLGTITSEVRWIPQISELASRSEAMQRQQHPVPSFGFLGRLSVAKGVELLMDIWRTNPPKADLHLMGEGALEAEVTKLAAETADRPHGRVFYHGAFSAAEREAALAEFFGRVDWLCVPSIVVGEGLPTVILEALQCGVPILTTPVGGTACLGLDWLRPTVANVVNLDDPADFSTRVHAVAAQGQVTDTQRQACIDYYNQWFSTQIVKESWKSVFFDDLGAKPTKQP